MQKLLLMDHPGCSIFCSDCQVKIHLYFLIGIFRDGDQMRNCRLQPGRLGCWGLTGRFLYGSAFATTLYLPFSATCSNSKLSSASRARCRRPPRPRRWSRLPSARTSCETWKERWLISIEILLKSQLFSSPLCLYKAEKALKNTSLQYIFQCRHAGPTVNTNKDI